MAARVEGYRVNGKDYGKLSIVYFVCIFNLTLLIVVERRKKGLRTSLRMKIRDLLEGVVMVDQGQVPVAGPVWQPRRV